MQIGEGVWEFLDTYEFVSFLGGGSFGQVAKMRVKGTEKHVAMKKLLRPFEREEDAKSAYREIRLLKHMNHPNVISLLNVFHPPARIMAFVQIYLVTHLMDEDLHRYSRSQRMSEHEIRPIIYQILRGLKYIHSAGVVHRDLKPCNIAVNGNNEVRILDFGLSRLCADNMTDFVGTMWYRAPEQLFLRGQYTKAIDMWAVGCILAELISGRVLFPGQDYFDQLRRLLDVMGTPTREFVSGIDSQYSRNYVERYPLRQRCDFHHLFLGADIQAVDLMEKMLEMVPERRITAADAMRHPYLRDLIEPHHHDEDIAPVYDQNFENLVLPVNFWKELISNEIQNFQPN
uniref:mitogen-activated protein kinase n=2 Tax=Drosophila erecta TaxID=7220 RepID=B3P787_DROER